MASGLTGRQAEVIRAIRASVETRGFPPTRREIAAAIGIRSTRGVVDHLRALEKKGYLTRDRERSRALRPSPIALLDPRTAPLGEVQRQPVSANKLPPLDVVDSAEHTVRRLPRPSFAAGADFAFLVDSERLRGQGVLAGDLLLVVRRLPHAGSITIARLGGLLLPLVYRELEEEPGGPKVIELSAGSGDVAPLRMPSPMAGRILVGESIGVWRQIFLDPPYSEAVRQKGLYAVDSGEVAADVLRWCREHGADKRLRIALCGYETEAHGGELEKLGWSVHAWKAHGGYGGQRKKVKRGEKKNENAARERIWFSPGCLATAAPSQLSLAM